ncbi:HAD family hydrolase [Candidatus Thorarchaeota archaeon]|nr:MAG: HAD family hydrolase [Candidatus Thorarchaeota archaeon]
MRIEGISCFIFDMGGTLYRPALDLCGLTRKFLGEIEETESRRYQDEMVLKALIEPNAWLDAYMIENNVGPRWHPSQEHWLEFNRLLLAGLGVKEAVEDAAVRYEAIWDDFLRGMKPQIIHGVVESLRYLSEQGFTLGIASNRFSDPMEGLERDGLLDITQVIEYSNVPGYRKPSPYLLLKVASRLGVNPRNCAYVGNIVKHDVVAATRAEMLPILLTWCDPQEKERITEDTLVINHISQLQELL